MPPKLTAPAAYLTLSAVTALAFALVYTLQAVYFVQTLHLTPLQLVLIGTVLELTCFLMEVPTGVVADTYSRRLSVLLGFVCLGTAFLILALVPSFEGALLAQVVGGLGYTFHSGALSAWIADEVGEEHVGALFLRAAQVGTVGGMVGIVLSSVLGSLNLVLPIVLGGVLLLVLAVFLALVMPERGFVRPPRDGRSPWHPLRATLTGGARAVRGSPALLSLIAVAVVYGASTEAHDRLWEYHLLSTFTLPVAFGLTAAHWFGLIRFGGMLLGLFVVESVRRRLDLSGVPRVARTLGVVTALGVVAGLAFALAGHFWVAVVAFWGVGVLRGVYAPLYDMWLNQGLDPRVRATVLSFAAQADAFGQIGGGPVLGWLGTVVGVRPALVLTALLRLPVLWLLARGARAERTRALAGQDASRTR